MTKESLLQRNDKRKCVEIYDKIKSVQRYDKCKKKITSKQKYYFIMI